MRVGLKCHKHPPLQFILSHFLLHFSSNPQYRRKIFRSPNHEINLPGTKVCSVTRIRTCLYSIPDSAPGSIRPCLFVGGSSATPWTVLPNGCAGAGGKPSRTSSNYPQDARTSGSHSGSNNHGGIQCCRSCRERSGCCCSIFCPLVQGKCVRCPFEFVIYDSCQRRIYNVQWWCYITNVWHLHFSETHPSGM